MTPFLRVLCLGSALIISCCSRLDDADEAYLKSFIHSWSPYHSYGAEPFQGHREWIFGEFGDSQAVKFSRVVQRWEAGEHAGIDSLSDRPTMKAIKRELHGLIDCYFALYRLDVTFPAVASQLQSNFVTDSTAKSDSLLRLADKQLCVIDSLGTDIALHGHEFNKLWRSFGETDTLQYRHRIPVRDQIVEDYVWFLAPELKRLLLSRK